MQQQSASSAVVRIQLLLVAIIALSAVTFVSLVEGQACTPQAGLTPTTANYLCPIGYINTPMTDAPNSFTCRKVNDMISSVNRGQSCRIASDCFVSNVDSNVYSSRLRITCVNGRCVRQSTRLVGDSCEWGGQCLSNRCDMNTKRCASTTFETASQGDRCGVSFEGNSIECRTNRNLRCLNERMLVGNSMSDFRFCHSPKFVGIGKSCVATDNSTRTYDACEDLNRMFCNETLGVCVEKLNDGSYCDAHTQCKSGDCVDKVCTTLKKSGESCQSIAECTNTLTCRSSGPRSSRTCQQPASLGDYCAADSDCFFNRPFLFGSNIISTQLVVCANQRCVRQFGAINGEKCERNTNCHSGYCDITAGVCKIAPPVNCDGQTPNICPNCACNRGTNNNGVCLHSVATNCPGFLMDLQFCVYNNFVTSLNDPMMNTYFLLARADIDSPFLDSESSLFRTCGPYYTNLMKCLHSGNSDKWTAADINGFSFSGTPTPNVLLPKVLSASNSVAYSLVLLVTLTLLSFLLF